jgi:hypothetical protein
VNRAHAEYWLSLDSGLWTVDCKCKTPSRPRGYSSFSLATSYWQLPTGRAAQVEVPSQGRVHWWISARKTPQKSHLVSPSGPPGVTSRWQSSIRKPFYARRIGSGMLASHRAKHHVGRGPPKVSYRCSLIIHYLWPESPSPTSLSREDVTVIGAQAENRESIPLAMRSTVPEHGRGGQSGPRILLERPYEHALTGGEAPVILEAASSAARLTFSTSFVSQEY